jgi:hypothetical protein
MKIIAPGLAILAAILTAAIILFLFIGAKQRLDDWRQQEISTSSRFYMLYTVHPETYHGVVAIKGAERQLIDVLARKPFLPLSPDEQKLLDYVKSDLQTTRLTYPVTIPAGNGNLNSTTLPTGTAVEVISQDGSNARIRYAGGEWIVPLSALIQ